MRGTPPGGRAGGSDPSGSGRGGTTTRRDAAPRDLNSIWGMTTTAASPQRRALARDAKRGAYGDLARNLDKLVECNHEGNGGSASSFAKDPRETDLGSKGDLS